MFGISKTKVPPDAPDAPDAPDDAPPCDPLDEDRDGLGNACDRCPADFDMGDDIDGDGVGDACDPDFQAPDRQVLFDGFDSDVAGWTLEAGSWQRRNGEFVADTSTDSRAELSITATTPTVEAIIPAYSVGATGKISVFGVAGFGQLTCSIVVSNAEEQIQMDAGIFGVRMQPLAKEPGTLRIAGGQHHDGTFYCRARHGTALDVEVTLGGMQTTIDKIGVATHQATATISAMVVYDVPP